MIVTEHTPDPSIKLFVNNIIVLENDITGIESKLPFYADGFPGIIFKQSESAAYLLPKKKKLNDFFLYGQTLQPIEISLTGTYKLIVFQVLPFVSKLLFNVNPQELNDECYDLSLVKDIDANTVVKKLNKSKDLLAQIEIITEYISELFSKKAKQPELHVSLAVHLILESKGKITVKNLTEQLHTTERTLQRLFIDNVGIPPKQLCKITQFQTSLGQISSDSFTRLTDIVYENGYADQSHFIRSFKKFTGKKPSAIKKEK